MNPAFDVTNPKSKRLLTEYYYYISDDPKHDSLFVQHCLNIHWVRLCEAGNTPSRHIGHSTQNQPHIHVPSRICSRYMSLPVDWSRNSSHSTEVTQISHSRNRTHFNQIVQTIRKLGAEESNEIGILIECNTLHFNYGRSLVCHTFTFTFQTQVVT